MNWAKVLGELASQDALTEPEGDGWKTMKEIKEESPYGDNKTRALVARAIKDGTMEVFTGSKMGDHGSPVRQVWYRPK